MICGADCRDAPHEAGGTRWGPIVPREFANTMTFGGFRRLSWRRPVLNGLVCRQSIGGRPLPLGTSWMQDHCCGAAEFASCAHSAILQRATPVAGEFCGPAWLVMGLFSNARNPICAMLEAALRQRERCLRWLSGLFTLNSAVGLMHGMGRFQSVKSHPLQTLKAHDLRCPAGSATPDPSPTPFPTL